MKRAIISLGGSLICPEEYDISFLRGFKDFIEEYLKKDFSFIIICGGGKLARKLQQTSESVTKITDEQKDWLGIEATKVNAFLVKSILNQSFDKVINDPTVNLPTREKLIICSGWKPGRSTDYDSVLLAINTDTPTVINMSNIDYVYDSDPNKNPKATPLKEISWSEFRKLVGSKWSPGLNMPFDPIASKEAEKYGIKAIIIGKDLDNLRKVLDGKQFCGTTIQ
jgi:uridylate kinase